MPKFVELVANTVPFADNMSMNMHEHDTIVTESP